MYTNKDDLEHTLDQKMARLKQRRMVKKFSKQLERLLSEEAVYRDRLSPNPSAPAPAFRRTSR